MKKKSCSRWRGPNRGLQTTQRQPKPPQNKDCGKLSHINTPVYMLIKLYCTEKNWWLETLSTWGPCGCSRWTGFGWPPGPPVQSACVSRRARREPWRSRRIQLQSSAHSCFFGTAACCNGLWSEGESPFLRKLGNLICAFFHSRSRMCFWRQFTSSKCLQGHIKEKVIFYIKCFSRQGDESQAKPV